MVHPVFQSIVASVRLTYPMSCQIIAQNSKGIMVANELRETLFVTILLTFLTQCVDYSRLTTSKSLEQVVIPQCTRKMSGYWSLFIWLYSFFFIWKAVQNVHV